MTGPLFVVTGGPGAGKTTLCAAIASQGVTIIPESGRAVIQEQVTNGGSALPWINPAHFADAVMQRDLDQFKSAQSLSDPSLFDRGFPDNAAYLIMLGLPVPAALDTLCRTCRFEQPVFVAPPWQAIYTQDAERKQNWAEAVRTHDAVVKTYRAYGYELVTLPFAPVLQRVTFMSQKMGIGAR
jgi:predicted ATPase